MDKWKLLEKQIEEAKKRAKETDAELDKSFYIVCPNCRKQILQKQNKIFCCAECGYTQESDEQKIKRALEEKGPMPAPMLAKEAGVSLGKVSAFFDDGMLSFSNDGDYIRCKTCGTPLVNGTVCSKCKNLYSSEFGKVNVREGSKSSAEVVQDKSKEPVAKMHFLGKRK